MDIFAFRGLYKVHKVFGQEP